MCCSLRNELLQKYLRPEHDLVLVLEGELWEYPGDLVKRLHQANPGGITASLASPRTSESSDFFQAWISRISRPYIFLFS